MKFYAIALSVITAFISGNYIQAQNLQDQIIKALKELEPKKAEEPGHNIKELIDALNAKAKEGQNNPNEVTPKIVYVGEDTITLTPDTGRLVLTVKSMGLRSPEAIKNNDSNLNKLLTKLKSVGIMEKHVRVLKHILNDDYREVEIYGGVRNQGTFKVKSGYAAYTTLDIRIPDPKKFQETVDIATEMKNQIHNAGYYCSSDKLEIEKSKLRAIEDAKAKVELYRKNFGEQYRVIGIVEETVGSRVSPAYDALIQITTKVKIEVEAPPVLEP